MGGKLHGTPECPEEQIELAGDRRRSGTRIGERPSLRALIWRFLGLTAVNTVALLAFEATSSDIGTRGTAVTAALIVLLNAFIWPTLARLTLPLTVWTLGLLSLALNGVLVALALALTPGQEAIGLGEAMTLVIWLAFVNSLLSSLFGLDDEATWQHRAVARRLRRKGQVTETDVPGVIFLEIDGLSMSVMHRALRDGELPTLARWQRSGTHQLMGWECDLSSQTSASQAGLLLGSNEGIPAFRWYEKDAGRVMVSSRPKDVAEIERRLSTGKGLLADGGASRVNLISGDADRRMFTLSSVGVAGRSGTRDYAVYFSQPFNLARTLIFAIHDIALEWWSEADQKRRRVWPRLDRSWSYPLLRAFTTVVQRDIAISALVQDMIAGTPRVYATFVGYDEVAHHSGVERADAKAVLRRLDAQFARLERLADLAPRPYEFVVLSDHGQSQGSTFHQKYGEGLEDVVSALMEGKSVLAAEPEDEGFVQLGAAMGDIADGGTVTGRALRGRARKRNEREASGELPDAGDVDSDVLVMPSGNLAQVYFPRLPGRPTIAEVEAEFPGLLDGLASHPGVGLVMVATGDEREAVAIGARGSCDLATGNVDGVSPLPPYGPNAARHLLRTHGFAACGDLLLLGTYDPATDEVTAFEQLCGSHGGMGGEQSHPFALFPRGWYRPSEPIIGAGTMHRVMKRWLLEAGQDVALPDGMDELPAPASDPRA